MLLPYLNENLIEAGCDEAGRGCLAGAVYAAAVILPKNFKNEMLNDSKQLSEKQRYQLREVIEKEALAWAIGIVEPEEIDKINILQASLLAMKLSYEKVSEKTHVDILYVDGNKRPDVGIECHAVVKGDQKIPEIMAASILAKTERDRIMKLCDEKWPQYGYSKHKGYPTKEHIALIEKYGPSPIARKTFMTKSEDETPSLF